MPGSDTKNPVAELAQGLERQQLTPLGPVEIDHKSVAFDVLQIVAPSYWLRILGLAHALAIDGIFANGHLSHFYSRTAFRHDASLARSQS